MTLTLVVPPALHVPSIEQAVDGSNDALQQLESLGIRNAFRLFAVATPEALRADGEASAPVVLAAYCDDGTLGGEVLSLTAADNPAVGGSDVGFSVRAMSPGLYLACRRRRFMRASRGWLLPALALRSTLPEPSRSVEPSLTPICAPRSCAARFYCRRPSVLSGVVKRHGSDLTVVRPDAAAATLPAAFEVKEEAEDEGEGDVVDEAGGGANDNYSGEEVTGCAAG